MKTVSHVLLAALISATSVAYANHHEGSHEGAHHEGGHEGPHDMVKSAGARAIIATIEAEIVAIDSETNEVTLVGPAGNHITIVLQEKVLGIDQLSIGDRVEADYFASLEAAVRAPTEEELANPWVVLNDTVVDENPVQPAAGVARQIRAVCTIEAADREQGYIMIKDSRGKMHTITDIESTKFDGVALGDTIVAVYTEALAVGMTVLAKTEM